MRNFILLFRNTLRRSRTMTFLSLVLGSVLIILFSLMKTVVGTQFEGIPIGFSPMEETAVTQDLRRYLTDEMGMQVAESTDMAHLESELVERNIAAAVVVPEGFAESLLGDAPLTIRLVVLDDYENAAFVRGYLESYSAGLLFMAEAAAGDSARLAALLTDLPEHMPPMTVHSPDASSLNELTQKLAFRQMMGFYLMFAFLLALTTAFHLFDDRASGLYDRIRASTVHSKQYLLGVGGMGLVNAIALISPLYIYIAVTRPTIGLALWQAVSLSLLYALFVVGAALFAAMYLRTKNAIMTAIIAGSTIMCLMGGAYFPITTSPIFLQRLALITPQFWFMDAMEKLQENPDASWLWHIGILLLFSAAMYIPAMLKHRRKG